jgi:hypothetical protein
VKPAALAGTPRRRMFVAWGFALGFGALVMSFAHAAYFILPPPRPLEELSYYPSGQHLEPATLGHAETAADLAWLRAVQYYGEHRKSDNQFTRMFHVFDILTSLAPGFEAAYAFGAFAMAQEGRDFASAERLMLKGLERNPTSGSLAFQLGFLHYVRPGGRDLARAAEFFEQASRQPDAPPQARRFAAFARQHSGNLAVAYELWSGIYQSTGNSELRGMAEREMRRIRRALETGRQELAVKRLATPRVLLK